MISDLFIILLFLWSTVFLFIIIQSAIWLNESLSVPKVFHWRRK